MVMRPYLLGRLSSATGIFAIEMFEQSLPPEQTYDTSFDQAFF